MAYSLCVGEVCVEERCRGRCGLSLWTVCVRVVLSATIIAWTQHGSYVSLTKKGRKSINSTLASLNRHRLSRQEFSSVVQREYQTHRNLSSAVWSWFPPPVPLFSLLLVPLFQEVMWSLSFWESLFVSGNARWKVCVCNSSRDSVTATVYGLDLHFLWPFCQLNVRFFRQVFSNFVWSSLIVFSVTVVFLVLKCNPIPPAQWVILPCIVTGHGQLRISNGSVVRKTTGKAVHFANISLRLKVLLLFMLRAGLWNWGREVWTAVRATVCLCRESVSYLGMIVIWGW